MASASHCRYSFQERKLREPSYDVEAASNTNSIVPHLLIACMP
jgi:delta14-sterol reductase